MNEAPRWPIRHILIGVPTVLVISAIIGAALEGWSAGKATVVVSAAMVSPVAMAYTFLVTLAERSYYMVFWAMEKTKGMLAQAKNEGEVQRDRQWRAWYERWQSAQREGRPFDEPPPDAPEDRNGR